MLWNLHLTFDYSTYSQKFAKFCGPLKIYELYIWAKLHYFIENRTDFRPLISSVSATDRTGAQLRPRPSFDGALNMHARFFLHIHNKPFHNTYNIWAKLHYFIENRTDFRPLISSVSATDRTGAQLRPRPSFDGALNMHARFFLHIHNKPFHNTYKLAHDPFCIWLQSTLALQNLR